MANSESDLLPQLTPRQLLLRHEPLPALVGGAGQVARFAYEEFFYGKLRNSHTRKAYKHAVERFLSWSQSLGLELTGIAPAHVGRYLDSLPFAVTTKKLHLAALRHFFDELVTRHVIILNPAASVRSDRHQIIEGKTPEIPVEQARRLLRSIDTTHVVGLRDRAIIGILVYTAVRVGAVAALRRKDLYDLGDQYCLRFTEKAGKSRELPVRHDLQRFLFDYLREAGLLDAPIESPFFVTTIRRTKQLTENSMTAGDMGRMVKRRLRHAGLSDRLSPHSFRVNVASCVMWRPGIIHGSFGDFRGWPPHNDPTGFSGTPSAPCRHARVSAVFPPSLRSSPALWSSSPDRPPHTHWSW